MEKLSTITANNHSQGNASDRDSISREKFEIEKTNPLGKIADCCAQLLIMGTSMAVVN
jgi:hypothetical protein